MPTPFTHLETAQRLLTDEHVPSDIRRDLKAEIGAFLLGNIAADARTETGGARVDTHFYVYDQPVVEHPWRVMLQQHPQLRQSNAAAQRAFLAGYTAHLSMDEYWTLNMVIPHIAYGAWGGSRRFRFYVLHLILIFMDERDLARLESWQPESLYSAQPHQWTPFLSDDVLCGWRDLIYRQIAPGGVSLTLEIFGGRIEKTPEELRAVLDSPELMKSYFWDNIVPTLLAQMESDMYVFAREQMLQYLSEFK